LKLNHMCAIITVVAGMETSRCKTLNLEGVTVTLHVQSREMRYRQTTNFSLGVRTQSFIQNASTSPVSLEPVFSCYLGTLRLLPFIMARTDRTKSQAGIHGHPTEECTIQRGSQWKVSPSIISFNLFLGVAAGLNVLGAAFCICLIIFRYSSLPARLYHSFGSFLTL
jgi:hypothetical protein